MRQRLAAALSAGFIAGLLSGEVLLGLGCVRHGADFIRMSPSTSHTIWIVINSVALYGLLGGAAGVVAAAFLHPVLRRTGSGAPLVFAAVSSLGMAVVAFLSLSVWRQLVVLSGLPLSHPDRVPSALLDGLFAISAGAAILLLSLVANRLGRRIWPEPFRAAVVVAVSGAILLGLAQFALRLRAPLGTWRPSQVAIVGLDALTFRVMAPMLRAGELPTFRRLIEEGAWGTFLTYGEASSPMVWTSMATGKRVRDHGIDDFVTLMRGGAGAEPMKSYDRRAKAIWNILSEAQLTVGVVDWLITFPPEAVNGYVVTRLHMDEANRTYPPELGDDVEQILAAPAADYGETHRTRNLAKIDRVFAVAHHLLDQEPLDVLMLFEGVTDWVEHRYWKYYEPDEYDAESWQISPEDVARWGPLIPDSYAHVDRRLGELIEKLDDDALLIVVSDHGQLAMNQPSVWVQIDALLRALGLLEFVEGESGNVDFSKSRAYAAVTTPWAQSLGVNVNLRGREPQGIVEREEADRLIAQIETAIRDVRFEDGTSVFGPVETTRAGEGERFSASEADVIVHHSRFTKTHLYAGRQVLVNGRQYPLGDFVQWNSKISGGHDRQGVIFVHGKGVRPGPIGQKVVSTALQELLWSLTDRVDAVDRLLPHLQRMGLVERATTLDLTPTVLYALGLPVAEDMSGRPLVGVVDVPEALRLVATYETGEEAPVHPVAAESDEEYIERLRELGYVDD